MIDDRDKEILSILQSEPQVSNAELARRVGMAPSGVLERVRRLEAGGTIAGYEMRLDPAAVDRGLLAFVFVKAEEAPGEMVTGDRLAAIDDVLEVHHVAGEDCYLVKVRVAGTEELGRLLRCEFGAIASVTSTRSTIVLETVKETIDLPIPAFDELEKAS